MGSPGGSFGGPGADRAIRPSDRPRAPTHRAALVEPVCAVKRRAALASERRSRVRYHPIEPVAALSAPVLPHELASVAAGAVLAVLAGTMLACLAVGNGGVALGCALAAMADVPADDPERLARERREASPLEEPDAGRGHVRRTRLNTFAGKQICAHVPGGRDRTCGVTGAFQCSERSSSYSRSITCKDATRPKEREGLEVGLTEPIAAHAAIVARDNPGAEVALVLDAAAAIPGHRAGLDPAALARDLQRAPPVDPEPVFIAAGATSVGPARPAAARRNAAVPWARRCNDHRRSGR